MVIPGAIPAAISGQPTRKRLGPGSTLLFVPGNRSDRFTKALAATPHGVILDLEDAVAPDAKEQARQSVLGWLASDEAASSRLLKGIRVNSIMTKDGVADLQALTVSAVAPDFVVLPKVESAFEVQLFAHHFASRSTNVELVCSIESAAGLEAAVSIAGAAAAVSMLAFGGGDLSRDLQCDMDWEPMLYARSRVVQAAAAARVVAADVPWIDLQDEAGLMREAERAYGLGFRAKLAIHPAQVPLLKRAMAPRESEIAWARKAVDAYERDSTGACVVDGKLVDYALYLPAKRLLDGLADHKGN
jgi:(S)-citramalyl-CoA lyase